jgi:hypothetical protein
VTDVTPISQKRLRLGPHDDDHEAATIQNPQNEETPMNIPSDTDTRTTAAAVARPARRHRSLAVGLACAVAVALPGVASAAGTDNGTDAGTDNGTATDQLRPRLERACRRVPNLQIRTDRLIERLQGDSDTLGSLLWLERQIERARENGRDQLVTVLENRLAVRTASLDVLELRADALDDLEQICIDLGVDL